LAAADRIVGRREFGGVLVVPAKVDLSPVRLIVDTGASVTALTPQAVERLALDRSRFTGRRSIFTAAGTYMTVPTGRIARLRLGAADIRNVEVAILNLSAGVNIDGLLGVNVLDRFRVTFEFRSATLVLRPEPNR
jgi:clan AA aspartic protease (TIGR02281 family)